MTIRDQLIELVERVATALGPDLAQVVFVGGVVPALYPLVPDLRPTGDVDVIGDLSRADYYALLDRLLKRGFRPCQDEGAPLCRYQTGQGEKRLIVDVMPTDPAILGFSNRWYEAGIQNAEQFVLPGGSIVRALSPEYFVATKLEAFKSRGNGDYGASHDIEDALGVLAALPEVLDGIASNSEVVCQYLRAELGALAANQDFLDTLAWHFPGTLAGEARAAQLAGRLEALWAQSLMTTP